MGKNKFQISSKRKIAFVCSGGGTKAGAFHLGVALALQEQGFKFLGGLMPHDGFCATPKPMEISTYVGSSAGSIISSYLAAGYSLENIFNSFLSKKPTDTVDTIPKILPRLTYPKMFKLRSELAKEQLKQLFWAKKIITNLMKGDLGSLLQLHWVKTTGLFSTTGIEEFLREEVLPSNRFQDYMADLFIVATQLNHSRKVVFGKYNYQPPQEDPGSQYNNEVLISEACAASISLPFIFAPYPITLSNNRTTHFIDGEIRDTLSTHVAADAGADLVIASYTHQPYHLLKSIGSLTEHGLPAILIQSIYLLIEQKINNHIREKKLRRETIDAVSNYCKQHGIDETHRKKLCDILESELQFRRDLDTIYIHPNPQDSKMFIREHFSLAPEKLTEIVRSGFKAAIDVLRHYEFADRQNAYPVGVTGTLNSKETKPAI